MKKYAAGMIVSNYKPFCAECQYFAQDSNYFYLPLPGKIYILILMMINDQDCLYLVRTKDFANHKTRRWKFIRLLCTPVQLYSCILTSLVILVV